MFYSMCLEMGKYANEIKKNPPSKCIYNCTGLQCRE